MRLSTAMRIQLASPRATRAATVTACAITVATLAVLPAPPAAGASQTIRAVKAHPSPAADGTVSPAAKRALCQGYLVPSQRAYERQKRAAAKAAPDTLPLAAPFSSTP